MTEESGSLPGTATTDEVVVRPARAVEMARVSELTVRAYLADGHVGVDDSYVGQLSDAEARHEHADLLVAVTSDGRVVGTVTVVLPGTRYTQLAGDDEIEFRMLAVDPGARRRGVGQALLRAVLGRAVAAGARHVVLSSAEWMTAAHRLYRRHGFERLPARDWSPRDDVRLVVFGRRL